MGSTLIHGATVLSVDAENRVFEAGFVAIRDGRITGEAYSPISPPHWWPFEVELETGRATGGADTPPRPHAPCVRITAASTGSLRNSIRRART